MYKHLLTLVIILGLFVGCGSKAPEQSYETIELAMLMDSTGHFVGDTIKVQGTVDHVCKHGGKKMFILGEDPKHRIKVTAGKAIGSYKVELEGSDVMVTAVVEEMRIDEAYLTNWEAELEAKDNKEDETHAEGEGSGDHMAKAKSPEQKNIDQLREKVCSAESGYLSFYSLAGLSYEVLP